MHGGTVFNRSAFVFLSSIMLCFAALSCRSPLSVDIRRSDLKLRFVVSGAASARASAASSRLLLPTAATLTATLTPINGTSGESVTRTATIGGGGSTVSLSFDSLAAGSYRVVADALDSAGIKIFTQTADLSVSASGVSSTLNLVPVDPEIVEALNDLSLASVELAANTAKTWRLPAGSSLLSGSALLLIGDTAEVSSFIQTLDGLLVESSEGSHSVPVSAVPAGSDVYVTLFNSGASSRAISLYAGLEAVSVPGGSFPLNGTDMTYVSPFFMGKYEVTQALYAAVTGENPSSFSSVVNGPVELVNWYGMLVFCNKLSALEGLTPVYSIGGSTDSDTWGAVPTESNSTWDAVVADWTANGYRLPTEAEWEWAARGATSAHGYPYAGSEAVGSVSWYNGNAAGTTHTIGTLIANELGLYDMSGNVWEACWDWFDAYPSGTQNNPTGSSSGSFRIRRGGSWWSADTLSAVAYRNTGTTAYVKTYDNGFRVARNGQPLYSVTYLANGASSGSVPVDTNLYAQGQTAAVYANTGVLTMAGIQSGSWNTQADGLGTTYAHGASVSVGSAPLTLYAQWPINLLVNPGWESDWTGWTSVPGGDWQILNYGRSSPRSPVSSYSWGSFSQTVDLTAAGYTSAELSRTDTVINYSCWVTGNQCGGTFNLTLELLDANDNVLATVDYGTPSIAGAAPWAEHTLSYTNASGLPISKARVGGGGQDSVNWAGNFGPVFDDAGLWVTVGTP